MHRLDPIKIRIHFRGRCPSGFTISISIFFPYCIYAIWRKDREHVHKIEKKVRVYKKCDAIDWNVFYAETDPDVLWDTILDCITGLLEIMCPYTNIFVRENLLPWFTQEIYECIYKRAENIDIVKFDQNISPLYNVYSE